MPNIVSSRPWEGEAVLPEGFEIDDRGLWYQIIDYDPKTDTLNLGREYITHSPIWLVRNARKLDSKVETGIVSDPDECYLSIRHLDNGIVREQTIAKSMLYKGGVGGVLGGKFNFLLRRGCVELFKDYLEFADMVCENTESFRDQTGWIKTEDEMRFGLYQENGILIKPHGEIGRQFRAIRQRGDREKYLEAALAALTVNPLACLPFAGVVAAPLLFIVNAPSGIIDISDSSSKGKTVSARLAMSVFGYYRDLETQWGGTAVGLEGSLEFFDDMPVFFDDAQNQKDKRIIPEMVYRVANGVGRQKGKPFGGVQEVKRRSTILLSTSERSLFSLAPEKLSGVNARITPAHGNILGNYTGDQVRELEYVIEEHHGWVGKDLIKYLESKADFVFIVEQHRYYLDGLLDYVADDDVIQGRKAKTYAALLCGIDVLVAIYPHHHVSFDIIKSHLIHHWKNLCSENSGHASVQEAISVLMDHYNKCPHHFDGTSATSKGILYKPQGSSEKLIGFYPTEFNKIMKSAGCSSENILAELMDRDWILYRSTPVRKKRNPLLRTSRGNDEIKLIVISKAGREAYNNDFS